MEIEATLKKIVENRKLKEEPLGRHSWICVLETETPDGRKGYRILHTGRLRAYETKPGLVAVIKERGGEGAYLLKVLQRIFKPNLISAPFSRTKVFALSDEDLSWLKSIPICSGSWLDNEVTSSLGFTTVAELKKQGLFPGK